MGCHRLRKLEHHEDSELKLREGSGLLPLLLDEQGSLFMSVVITVRCSHEGQKVRGSVSRRWTSKEIRETMLTLRPL